MKKNITTIVFLFTLCFIIIGCTSNKNKVTVTSPNSKINVTFLVSNEGEIMYKVAYNNKTVIDSSFMGFDFKEQKPFSKNFQILNTTINTIDETWEMPWGEQLKVRNHYNELTIYLQETNGDKRNLNIQFKVYNDGLGFRYKLPKQKGVEELLITDENTQFKLTKDHNVWWIPGDWDIYEHLYSETKFTEIDALKYQNHPNLAQTYIPQNAVNTPVTMKTEDGIYLSFHEANLTNYAGMTLKINGDNLSMTSELVGSENLGGKAKITLPFKTPWRTIQIAERAGDLIESKLIVNLNEPNKIGDVSYFTPMKYVGIWWEMHIGKSNWDLEGSSQDLNNFVNNEKRVLRHGATTENAKRYIKFASENGIKGLLVEGWNTGWDKWINHEDREGVFDFITPYPDYNFKEVMAYAKEKGVEVIMHHETSSAPLTYEKQMHEAYDFMKANGINSVKTGYVGKIIPKGEYHHGQWMVNHYHKVLVEAAKQKIAVNAHEPIKDTGKRRTYPNAISREGLRGQEFNAWSIEGGNPTNHLPTVAFTRMLSGPIDFTPGVFNIKFNEYKPNNQVNTTLAHQLALYVVIYSPIQMACDLPENYEENGEIHPAFQFITDVGVDWEFTKVLDGEIGDFVTIARKEKGTNNWFVGGITNEDKRTQNITFNFLEKGKTYSATIYKDGPNAHWDKNPKDYVIEKITINYATTLNIKMAEGGGFAISLIEKK